MSKTTYTLKRKPGRPPTGITRIRQNLSLTPALMKSAKRAARKNGQSLSALVEAAVRNELKPTAGES